jgi:phosphoglycerate kinase
LATFQHVVGRGGRLVIAAHRGRPEGKPSRALSLEPVGSRLAELTGWEVLLPDECVGDMARKLVGELRSGQVCLLENLRFDPGEEQDDEVFVRDLGRLADVFIADAFGVLHLAHASVVGLPKLLRLRTAGFALRRELEAFARLDEPPTLALLGGAFAAGVPLVEALLRRAVPLLVGGPLGSTLLAAQGQRLGASAVDNAALARARTLLEHARQCRVELGLPVDFVIGPARGPGSPGVAPAGAVPPDHSVLDVGPRTVAEWRSRLVESKSVLLNGHLEMTPGSAHPEGTLGLLAALAEGPAFSLVGPDSAAGLGSLGLESARFGHVTRGAEAATELLLGKRLPGLEQLRSQR